jgi:hypothetical protein
VNYTANTITKTTAGLLGGGNVVETQTLDGATLQTLTTSTDFMTRDIAGATVASTRTTTRTYDAIGRVISENGPLNDLVARDETTMVYYTLPTDALHDFGRLKSVTKYVGTSSSSVPLTTTYSQYDVFGVPHRITQPNGDYTTYADSNGRLTWTIVQKGSDNSTIATSVLTLNGDGTTRSYRDPDGVCLTYDYKDSSGYVGAPTVIRRSNTNCGTLPINLSSGEVEIRTYVAGERDRLQSVERRSNGVTHYTYSGFTYDRDRRVTNASTLDSPTPFTFGFTDMLPSSTVAPGAPADGSWRTDSTADEFGRPSTLLRFLDATNKQTYSFAYATPFTPRPTQLARGLNGSSTSITTFVYDDLGRLVETTVPEAGTPGAPAPTRYEYDVASRMLKKRIGVGTSGVRTSVYTYDSLGRTMFVDHDTEHPVDCATSPDGTPIQDEEYRYDGCSGDAPSGVTCTNALGRLTISRSLLQCSSGAVVKRGRWYSYDKVGRVSRVSYATVIGTSIGGPSDSYRTYTAAGRPVSLDGPLGSFGTSYTYDAASGQPSAISTSGNAAIAHSLAYAPFGSLLDLNMAVAQPSTGGTRALFLRTTQRSDGSLNRLSWHLKGPSDVINLLTQTMSYSPAGAVTLRDDAADMESSRFYKYDPLLRMTCEARGTSSLPSSSDCVTSSQKLAGLYTYGNGQSASSPPDVRLTSFIKGAGTTGASYTSPSTETYTYSSGSGQTQQINRTGSNIEIGYDALGRRSFDKDSADNTSRRDYAYLPNGQLRSVTGTTLVQTKMLPYTIEIRYDAEGHPLTITSTVATTTTTYELFWDDEHRLIAARIDDLVRPIRWHYHYLGSTLLAATRTDVISGVPQVKRFWAISDERGLIYRMLDEQGATFWQARWDASGWRQLVGAPQPNMWVPFGLPGQVLLDESKAFAGLGTQVRPELAINQRRGYDPMTGSFLQPDGADQTGRLDPEGYSLSRNNPPRYPDPRGNQTYAEWHLPLKVNSEGCDDDALSAALNVAALQIISCPTGACSLPGGEKFRRMWIYALASSHWICAVPPSDPQGRRYSLTTIQSFARTSSRGSMQAYGAPPRGDMNSINELALDDWRYYLSPFAFANAQRRKISLGFEPCLARLVAHEVLHAAIRKIAVGTVAQRRGYDLVTPQNSLATAVSGGSDILEEDWVSEQVGGKAGVAGCVKCN